MLPRLAATRFFDRAGCQLLERLTVKCRQLYSQSVAAPAATGRRKPAARGIGLDCKPSVKLVAVHPPVKVKFTYLGHTGNTSAGSRGMVLKGGRAHLGISWIINNPRKAALCLGHAAIAPFGDARQVSASLCGRASGMAPHAPCGSRRTVNAIGGEIPPQVCAPLWKRLKAGKPAALKNAPYDQPAGVPTRAGGAA